MSRRSAIAPALSLAAGLAVAVLAPVGLALTAAPARPGAPTLVVAPPWVGAASAVEAAGGRVIALRHAPLATLAVFERPGIAARLAVAGAWLATDGAAVAALCGVRR